MKSSKKLVIAVSSLILTFVVAIVAVVAIFAAQNQSVRSTLTVRYTAVDVSARVRANYIVGTTSIAMLTDDGEEELVFLPTSESGGSLTPQDEDIELTSQNDYVVFEYIFTNDSNSIDVAIDLDTTAFTTNNMIVSYAYSYTKINDMKNMSTTENFVPIMILGEAKEEGKYETVYIYVKAKISNLANDAYFEGNMDFSLTKATPVKLTFENVTNATNKDLLKPIMVPANTPINLPSPTFADGENYAWFNESTLETVVTPPVMLSEDTVVYPGISPIAFTVSEEGESIIENISDEELYLQTESGTNFTYGQTNYTNDSGSYVLVDAGQSVAVSSGGGAANVNYASPVSDSNAVKKVSVKKPTDLEEKKFYAAYGAYPQTYVGNALNEELKNATLTATGKSYTTFIDEYETILTEYSYKGKTYAKLNSALTYYGDNIYKFSTGDVVSDQGVYFFCVEPIVVRATQKNADGTYTMMSVNALGSKPIRNDYEQQDNSWQNSNLRAYLNDEFLNESMLTQCVVEQSIKNDDYYGSASVSGNTVDKIWIASVEEILNWTGSGDSLNSYISNYGLDDENNYLRSIKLSDMAVATYSYCNEGTNTGYCFLRTPGPATSIVASLGPTGSVIIDGMTLLEFFGFVPVFAVYV